MSGRLMKWRAVNVYPDDAGHVLLRKLSDKAKLSKNAFIQQLILTAAKEQGVTATEAEIAEEAEQRLGLLYSRDRINPERVVNRKTKHDPNPRVRVFKSFNTKDQ